MDFGLDWMDKVVEEPEDMEDVDEEGVEMEVEEGQGRTLEEVFGLGEFMDLIQTFLRGGITTS